MGPGFSLPGARCARDQRPPRSGVKPTRRIHDDDGGTSPSGTEREKSSRPAGDPEGADQEPDRESPAGVGEPAVLPVPRPRSSPAKIPPGGAGGGQTDHAAAQSLTPGSDPEPGPASPARRKVKSSVLRCPVPEQEPGVLISVEDEVLLILTEIIEGIESFTKNEVFDMNEDNKDIENYSKSKNSLKSESNDKIESKSVGNESESKSISKSKSYHKEVSSKSNKIDKITSKEKNQSLSNVIDNNQSVNVNERVNTTFQIPNLVKDFRLAKDNDRNIVEISKDPRSVTVATCNPGGLRSKFMSVENICFRNNVSALAVCETHYAGRVKPFVSKNYSVFFKNRRKSEASCKGGVALFLKNEIAEHAVVIDQGESNQEEYLAVKVNCYSPPLLLFVLYGPQQNAKKETVTDIWNKVMEKWQTYKDKGWTVVAMGDFNSATGDQTGLPNNHPSMNLAGKLLLEGTEKLGWNIANKKAPGDPRTHVDRSSQGSSRCLDYIVVSDYENCIEVKVDNELAATPYTVQLRDGQPYLRRYSDHKTVDGPYFTT